MRLSESDSLSSDMNWLNKRTKAWQNKTRTYLLTDWLIRSMAMAITVVTVVNCHWIFLECPECNMWWGAAEWVSCSLVACSQFDCQPVLCFLGLVLCFRGNCLFFSLCVCMCVCVCVFSPHTPLNSDYLWNLLCCTCCRDSRAGKVSGLKIFPCGNSGVQFKMSQGGRWCWGIGSDPFYILSLMLN